VPVPFPSESEVNLEPPSADEVRLMCRGIVGAVAPPGGLTPVQHAFIPAIARSMTGHDFDPDAEPPIGPEALAEALARRNAAFRGRIVQHILFAALVLSPLPEEIVDRVGRYATELGIDDGMLRVAQRYSKGNLGLAAFDFERNGYTADWTPERARSLHTSGVLAAAWEQVCDDPALARQWADLEGCAPGTLGRRVWEFYRARGFAFPGAPNSAPPYLAQHDWVHVLADYGTQVDNELEVFTLIGRATDDPRGFSLVAMVVSLFETGYLRTGAGLFEADRGHHLSATPWQSEAMAERVANAMYRGAMLRGRDLMEIDWFEHADQPLPALREEFGLPPRSARARAYGSRGPWEPGGISEYQLECGRRLAAEEGRPYESYGATEV
jgi:hypothetical protein